MLDKSPLKNFASQQSRFSIDSPRKAAGVRHFADIAADPSPPIGSAETELDLDAIMSDVVTADDRQFLEALSSPPSEPVRKRQRTIRAASRKWTLGTSPEKQREELADKHAAGEVQSTATHTGKQDEAAQLPEAVPTLQQSSPCKANKLPVTTNENDDTPKGTQDSVKKREAAGASAVSQLLSARSTRSSKFRDAGKQAATPVPVKVAAKATNKLVKLKLKTTAPAEPGKGRKDRDAQEVADAAQDELNVETEGDRDGLEHHEPARHEMTEATEAVPAQVCAPHRMFALFKGQYNAFFPATWLSTSADGTSYLVRFDDTTDTMIEAHFIRSLDLRVGDQVKLEGQGMRKKTWVIQSFGPVAQTEENKALGMDIYGRVVAKVQAKATRNSLPANDAAALGEGKVLEVLITNIYLTHTLWSQFTDRAFVLPDSNAKRTVSRPETPSAGVHTPNVETPGSRSRRATLPSARARTSHLREESVASLDSPRVSTGVFTGMAFAISYGSNEAEKAAVTRQIQNNGGVILENGFDELFELPDIQDDATPPSPKKRSPRKGSAAAIAETSGIGLRLKPEYQALGFVALIADRHSRRAKYMQALALGLPTLSGRWITDSLDASKNVATATGGSLPWHKYLLPAGESAYLSGAIRSRTMPIYSAADAKLANTIANRDILLNGDGVLIVASLPKKGNNSAWQRRKAYAFLTLALGAGKIKRVSDLREAQAALRETEDDGDSGALSKWKWVYVDGSVSDAGSVLFKGSGSAKDKKRKRGVGDDVGRGRQNTMSAGDGNVKVVNDEFVVQSLILGALVD